MFAWRKHVVTEHWSILTRMKACIATGNILGMNSRIGMGDMGISLVQTNNIIAKSSLYEGSKIKQLGVI